MTNWLYFAVDIKTYKIVAQESNFVDAYNAAVISGLNCVIIQGTIITNTSAVTEVDEEMHEEK